MSMMMMSLETKQQCNQLQSSRGYRKKQLPYIIQWCELSNNKGIKLSLCQLYYVPLQFYFPEAQYSLSMYPNAIAHSNTQSVFLNQLALKNPLFRIFLEVSSSKIVLYSFAWSKQHGNYWASSSIKNFLLRQYYLRIFATWLGGEKSQIVLSQ